MWIKSKLLPGQSLMCLKSQSCSHSIADFTVWHGALTCMKVSVYASWIRLADGYTKFPIIILDFLTSASKKNKFTNTVISETSLYHHQCKCFTIFTVYHAAWESASGLQHTLPQLLPVTENVISSDPRAFFHVSRSHSWYFYAKSLSFFVWLAVMRHFLQAQ